MSPGAEHLEQLLRARGVCSAEELISARYGFAEPFVDETLVCRMLSRLPCAASLDRLEATLVEAVVIGETHFMRHRSQLEWLLLNWLPPLASRAPDQPVRVLFAGCSTGEEVWSFLGTLGDTIEAMGPWGVDVVAVDASERSLAIAEARVYRSWSLRGVDLSADGAWLSVSAEGDVRVSDRLLRHDVSFERHNLLEPLDRLAPPGGFDLVLCRNVLLYFDPAAAGTVWQSLVEVLAPDGLIVTAATDPQPPSGGALTRSWEDGFPVHRRRSAASARAESAPPPRPAPPRAASRPRPRSSRPPTAPSRPSPPDSAGALSLIARLASTGEPDLARSLAEESLERHPEDPAVLVLLAVLASEAGDHAAAVSAARRACYLAADSP